MTKLMGIEIDEPTYHGYKTPLKPVKGGFGYMGVIASNHERTHIQCHVCGLFFESVAQHSARTHKLKAAAYKEKFGLAKTSSLVGEELRNQLVTNQLNLTERQKIQRSRNIRKAQKANKRLKGRKISLEQLNKDGRCPDQLIDKIQKASLQLGHTPSREEFREMYGGYIGSLIGTFGSWARAVRVAELEVRTGGSSEFKYSDKELLAMLNNFYDQYGRTPRYSDFKRGLIPSPPTYRNRFGTIAKARELAGLPNLLKIKVGKNQWEWVEEIK